MRNNNKLIQGSGPKILGLGSKINTSYKYLPTFSTVCVFCTISFIGVYVYLILFEYFSCIYMIIKNFKFKLRLHETLRMQVKLNKTYLNAVLCTIR